MHEYAHCAFWSHHVCISISPLHSIDTAFTDFSIFAQVCVFLFTFCLKGCNFGRLFVICVLCLARNIAGKKYIALLGGTGGVGRKFIDLALDRGHYVKALVR